MKYIEGGVTAPVGFLAAGVVAGIKKSGKPDVAIVYSEVPAQGSAVYTLNKFKAAPLVITEENLADGQCQAIIINSGIANAGMGQEGLSQAKEMSDYADEILNLKKNSCVIASTGVIGMPLPMDKIKGGIEAAAKELEANGSNQAAIAIMTTDLVSKEIAVEIELDGKSVHIGAMAKGSGMIHPNMATMLGFVTTDAKIHHTTLKQLLREVTDETFNMISVDGDTSTNDMVAIMANGLAGNEEITLEHPEMMVFKEALLVVCKEMAKSIARDGEGATKLLECKVTGAKSISDARLAAKAVIASSLVKSAMYGKDANWGRIAAAVGYSGADFDPLNVDIYLGDIMVSKDGMGLAFDEVEALDLLEKNEVQILVQMSEGDGEAVAWGCDLTYDYVRINADYRS